ncbi:MAG: hypothetical protein DRO18_03495 [Thermoprotei archaeon]|nr:MAG: hypothetical protein DRO18_03495 [Thermoprotei archaeon]
MTIDKDSLMKSIVKLLSILKGAKYVKVRFSKDVVRETKGLRLIIKHNDKKKEIDLTACPELTSFDVSLWIVNKFFVKELTQETTKFLITIAVLSLIITLSFIPQYVSFLVFFIGGLIAMDFAIYTYKNWKLAYLHHELLKSNPKYRQMYEECIKLILSYVGMAKELSKLVIKPRTVNLNGSVWFVKFLKDSIVLSKYFIP